MDQRRTFSREFKLAAVKKVIEHGMSYAQVARDLDVRDNLIRNWKKAFEKDGTLQAEITSNNSIAEELKPRSPDRTKSLKPRFHYYRGS